VPPRISSDVRTPVAQLPPAEDGQRDKRDRIIERAIIMFNELGFDRVRIIDITDSLGMGKGTFYLYFRNKKDLLLRCFDHVGDLILELESLPEIREGDFFAKVRPRVENIGRRAWFPGLVNLLRAAELSPDAEVKSKAREAYESLAVHLRRDLDAAIVAGRARDVDADLAAYGFVGMAENLWFRSRLDNRYAPDQIVAFMADETRHWLSSAPAVNGGAQSGAARPVRLVCCDGTRFDLANVRFGGETTIRAAVGPAEIDLDPARLARLVLDEGREGRRAQVTAIDGTDLAVQVDGSLVVSGEAALGTVRIAIREVSSLAWSEPL
jgi:AcrR family transcriptional regulator